MNETVRLIENCIASMERDIYECDKMYIHISDAKNLIKHLTLTQPNKPLSLYQLKHMDGELVRVPESDLYFGGMGIVNISEECVNALDDGHWNFYDYETGWTAYRTKPEQEEQP